MSSSALLIKSQASLDNAQCSGLLSPKLSSDVCQSPRWAGLQQKPTNAPACGGFSLVDKDAAGERFSGEFDRGPDAAALAKLRGSWQLAMAGKPAAAAVLTDLNVQRIPDGGPDGVKALAAQLVSQHQLDDTFYVMDLANPLRLFKTRSPA